MAITITDQPTNFAKVGQKLMIVATSTNVAQPNFRYVVRVGNIVTAVDLPDVIVPPNPQNRLMFDLSQVIKVWCYPIVIDSGGENYIVGDSFNVSTNSDECLVEVKIEVLEAYDVAGVFTIQEGSVLELDHKMIMTASYTVSDGYKPDPNLAYSITSTTAL